VAAGSHNLVVVAPEQMPEQELVPDTAVLAAADIPGKPVEQEQEHRMQELALEWGMVAGIVAAAVAETTDKRQAVLDSPGQMVPQGMPRWGSRRVRLRRQSLPTNRP